MAYPITKMKQGLVLLKIASTCEFGAILQFQQRLIERRIVVLETLRSVTKDQMENTICTSKE